MERLQRAAIVSSLAEALLKNGSWCGETHLQKSVYLLQVLCNVPSDFDFVLYKHGPFSFDLSSELMSMRADGLLDVLEQYPYGPKLVPTPAAAAIQKRLSKTMKKYSQSVLFIAAQVGSKTVADLEKLATALYVEREQKIADIHECAQQIHGLKPHISADAARAAIDDLRRIENAASILQSSS
jgi:uncharacterized protein YwgA